MEAAGEVARRRLHFNHFVKENIRLDKCDLVSAFLTRAFIFFTFVETSFCRSPQLPKGRQEIVFPLKLLPM